MVADSATHDGIKLLYSPAQERDSCGVGFVADSRGIRSNRILTKAVESVINLTHRGAVSADGKTGDGAGVLTQIPHRLFTTLLAQWNVRLAREEGLLLTGRRRIR